MSRLYAALATSARLRAEVSNKPLVFPDELNKFPELIESETALYNTRRDGLNKATTGLTQGIAGQPRTGNDPAAGETGGGEQRGSVAFTAPLTNWKTNLTTCVHNITFRRAKS